MDLEIPTFVQYMYTHTEYNHYFMKSVSPKEFKECREIPVFIRHNLVCSIVPLIDVFVVPISKICNTNL